MFVPVSWSYSPTPSTISAWRVYASESEDTRGVLVAEVDAAERSTEIEVGEGTFYVRVVGLYRDGTEAPWESATSRRLDVSGQETTPSEPENAAVAAVDPQSARVEVDPPAHADGDDTRIQVLELPAGETDPALGVIVAEQAETIAGPLAPRGVRQPGPLVAVEGSGDLMPTTRRLAIRRVTPFGAASPATVVDVPVVDRPNHYTVVVASVSGTTLVGFASPASTDPWETDATDGVRLKQLPVVDDWDTDYGYPDDWGGDSPLTADGILRENRYFGAYADFARLSLAATKDFGETVDFVLEAWHPVSRGSVEGCVEDEVVDNWDFPIDALGMKGDLTDVDAATRVSGAVGVFRDAMLDGTPMPLTRDAARLLYVVGTSSPLSTDPADRKPYVPGAVLRGRYLDVYLELREPSGMHQLIMPKCVINARVLMRRTVSSGAPSHAAPPGSIHVDESAQKVYVKTAGVGTSGHTEMATRPYVDAAVAGLDWKASVRVATSGGLTLATDVEAGDTIDGVTLVAGDRVLVKNQASGAENGIYVVQASGAPVRATDADSSDEVTAGLAVFVAEGTTNADTCWVLTTNDTITLGSTALVFTQFGTGSTPDADATTKGKVQLAGDLGGTAASPAIANNAVTNAKAADMAQSTIKGRAAGAGTGDPTDLSAAQATAILDAVVGDSGAGGTKGLVPAPSAGDAAAEKYLGAGGSFITAPGRLLNRYFYTSGSGATHTPNAACTKIVIRAQAPGGGGGGGDTSGSNSGAGAGGGAGGYVEKLWAANGNITYTVPAGGSGGSAGNNAGTAGSDLTVTGTGLSLTAKGGTGGGSMAGGTGVASAATGGNTSGSTGGDLNQEGQGGQRGSRISAAVAMGGKGAASHYGDGGSGGGSGGDVGGDAASYGAGGGGGTANAGSGDKAGGAGGGGLLIIEEYA